MVCNYSISRRPEQNSYLTGEEMSHLLQQKRSTSSTYTTQNCPLKQPPLPNEIIVNSLCSRLQREPYSREDEGRFSHCTIPVIPTSQSLCDGRDQRNNQFAYWINMPLCEGVVPYKGVHGRCNKKRLTMKEKNNTRFKMQYSYITNRNRQPCEI